MLFVPRWHPLFLGIPKSLYGCFVHLKCRYLFNSYFAILRRQDFVFKVFFSPVLLTRNVVTIKNSFDHLKFYRPDHIGFYNLTKVQVAIKCKDPIYTHHKIDITF